ncbi:MAG: hypothetical protein K0R69_322 [Clostridia bacterium]|jgi:hypothetical protein|nr:hypothetical protein [Clostridia bacterium]
MKFFKKSDVIVILIIIVISVVSWVIYHSIFSKKAAKAEIYYYSELVETVDLNTGVERTFSIPQDEHVIFHLYKDGKIRFEESDCPDKVCIKTGKLSMVGQSAACLPNAIILKIVPEKKHAEDDLDMIAQ